MIEYEINLKKKTVVAYFLGGRNHWWNNLYTTLEYLLDDCNINTLDKLSATVTKVLEGRKLFGMARCHPDDTFDVKEGKELAKKDLMRRYRLAQARAVAEMRKVLTKRLANFYGRSQKYFEGV